MLCTVDSAVADAVWPAVLELQRRLRDAPVDVAYLVRRDGAWRLASSGPGDEAYDACLVVPIAAGTATRALAAPRNGHPRSVYIGPAGADGAAFAHPHGRSIHDDELAIFQLYLPVLLGRDAAERGGRTFVTAHVAQTLDGRIACHNGHSRWISNEANLRHSHRLRALSDAVLVGARTLASDDPQLTVRHCAGDDPRRIVVSGSGAVLADAAAYKVRDGRGCTVVCRADRIGELDRHATRGMRLLPVPVEAAANGRLGSEAICAALHGDGVRTLFVEGGGVTLSNFLADRRIDLLHVHVAPRILGSGIRAFTLPVVDRIQEARSLQVEHYTMDGELLLACRELAPAGGVEA